MVSSEERREVAERLRSLAAHGHGISCDAVDKALGIWYDDSYSGCVFARESVLRLADLIDPTCEMTDASWDNGECTWGCICSACDAHIEHEKGRFLDYCPRCGARVVSGDDC